VCVCVCVCAYVTGWSQDHKQKTLSDVYLLNIKHHVFLADGAVLDNTAILLIWHNDQTMHRLLTYKQQRIVMVKIR